MNTNDASISLGLLSYPCYTLDLFGVRFVPPQETIVWGNNLRVLGLLLNIMFIIPNWRLPRCEARSDYLLNLVSNQTGSFHCCLQHKSSHDGFWGAITCWKVSVPYLVQASSLS